jgi:AcrR family transcriptional regulator
MAYSSLTARQIREADPELLGVKFGLLCLERDIPIADVADYLHVSPPTVYAWFRGETVVSEKHAGTVAELLKKLT